MLGRQPAFLVVTAGKTSLPPTPTVSCDFSGPTLPSGWAVSRSNTSGITDMLFTDPVGRTITDFTTANTPRFRAEGLLMEPTRSNFLPNSNAPLGTTQNGVAALGVRAYLFWFHGTGSVTLSGTTAVSAQFGTPITQAMCPYFINVTTGGGFNATPTGQVLRWQFEQADSSPNPPIPTSFIKTTNALITRASELLYCDPAAWLNATAGTYLIECQLTTYSSGQPILMNAYSADTTTDRETVFTLTPQVAGTAGPGGFRGNTLPGGGNLGGADVTGVGVPNQKVRCCYVAGPNRRVVVVNSSDPGVNVVSMPRPTSLTKIGLMGSVPGGTGGTCYGFITKFYYWSRELTYAQAQTVTKLTWTPS